ncbi:putative phosphodiesterase [Aminobacter niigataensis]|uniref:Phosphodiesterase n=1 Tax=Aminobacter niigataensis TaxID=83265 RepID=A0ABR6L936_9HYPH|nr:metallophosphoesterase [Aminobacter niigataensis]MBB4653315.1 putative phosphodiesterase [Aminobacter niigataensis]
MKLWILSDLHFDPSVLRHNRGWSVPEADVAVVAGDVASGGVGKACNVLEHQVLPHMPVVFVPGTHEFYGASILEEREHWRERYRTGDLSEGLHVLDCTSVMIGGTRFLGTTLWTDFELDGSGTSQVRDAMRNAESLLNDYRYAAWRVLPQRERLTAERTRALHRQARHWLEAELARPRTGPVVVVTHHAPHPGSVHPDYRDSTLNAAFASDLHGLIVEHGPDLWVHGHTHNCFDYRVAATRIVCNPLGYHEENRAFDPALVIELCD